MRKGIGFVMMILLTCSVIFAAGESEDTQKSISILFSEHPTITVLDKDLEEFTELTGIELIIDRMPESGTITKGALALSSRTGEYDIIMSFGNRAAQYAKAEWIESLDKYIEKESSDFDFGDLLPALMPVLSNDGKIYGLPLTAETNILYYNKEIFKKAGLQGPPTSVDEMVEYAKKIKEAGFSGIALRGEGYASVFPWVMFRKLYGIENLIDDQWIPTFDSKKSIMATETWAEMLQEYGPKGIAQYGWQEVKLDFQQGKVGMIMDTSMWSTDFEDPSKSEVAGKVGYAHIPGPGNKYNVISCWAFYMSADSNNKEAAWEFLKWATSKELQLKQALRGERTEASRASVWADPKFEETYGKEWARATAKSLAHADPFYYPIIPEISEIRTALGNRLSAILSKQESASEALTAATEEGIRILDEAGYYK